MSSVSAWDDLSTDWDDLFEASPAATPALDRRWLRTWWEVYGNCCAQPDGLRLMTVRQDGRLVGLLPLYAAARGRLGLGLLRWRFLSTGEAETDETCADYLDLLYRAEQEGPCRQALRAALAQGRERWDELILGPVAASSPLLDWGSPAADWAASVDAADVCPVADLGGGFEAYLQRLSANGRQQARRLLRATERAGGRLEFAQDEPEVEQFFDELVGLHQQRWRRAGRAGCFASPRFTAFHRRLARAWVPAGKAVLARLTVAGRAAAVLYGFRVRAKVDFYQCGVDLAGSGLRSPGLAAHLFLMRHLAGQGVQLYDFLRGHSAYKDRLATDHNTLATIRVGRRGVRAAVAGAWRRASDLARWRLQWGRPARSPDGPAVAN